MAQKVRQNLFKKPAKPHGTGILRLQVLNCLLEAEEPLRVVEIGEALRGKGIRHSMPTIYQAVYEIAHAVDQLHLRSVTVTNNGIKAEAYFISLRIQSNVQSR